MSYRTLALLLLTLPLAAQIPPEQQRFRRPMSFPPDIISDDVNILDAAKLDPGPVRIDTENTAMRVLRISLAPGDSLRKHDDRDGLLVCLSECHITFVNASGSAREVHLDAGQTRWISGERRKTINTGNAPVEFLY